MFQSAGNFTGKVLAVALAESKYNPDDPDAFDVCLQLQGPDLDGKQQIDWWRGEISGKYGRGNVSHKTQYQITMEALHSAGFEGSDLSGLEKQMVGKEINFKVEGREYQGKTYYDIKYIGGGNYAPKAITANVAAEKLARITAKMGQTPTPQPAKPAAPAQPEQEDDLPW
jgi:hypothetical protein